MKEEAIYIFMILLRSHKGQGHKNMCGAHAKCDHPGAGCIKVGIPDLNMCMHKTRNMHAHYFQNNH